MNDYDEREDRAQNHRRWVYHEFGRYGWDHDDAWENGLVVMYVRGSDHGRIHRASCPAVSRFVNAFDSRASAFVEAGINPTALRCRTCGTGDLPVGAGRWDDTADVVAARKAAREAQQAAASREREAAMRARMVEVESRSAATQALIAAHADEYEALLAAEVAARSGR